MKILIAIILFVPLASIEGKELKPRNSSAKSATQTKKSQPTGHPFSWPFMTWEEMAPRGGTTKGSKVTLDSAPNPVFASIHQEGIPAPERDRRAILAMAGSHRVSFDFIETASSAHPYTPPKPYFSWATEKIIIIENREDFISLQHILVMEFVDKNGKTEGPFTMKHWRQDWTFQATETLQYQGEETWMTAKNPIPENRWTQAVYQVDDSPRYENSGTWDHTGGLSIFHTDNAWRPLPRREFSVRKDYNVLDGHHQITISPDGWLHTQLNRKILTKDGKIVRSIATELGTNRYQRISKPSILAADDYWRATQEFWAAVRLKWKDVARANPSFTLHERVDDKPMFAHLFELAAKLEDPKTDQEARKTIIEQVPSLIDRFVTTQASATPPP